MTCHQNPGRGDYYGGDDCDYNAEDYAESMIIVMIAAMMTIMHITFITILKMYNSFY